MASGEGAGLRGVLFVLAKVFLEVGVVDKGGAAGELGVDDDPVGFQERPESLVESIGGENLNVYSSELGGLVRQHCFAKLKEHAGNYIFEQARRDRRDSSLRDPAHKNRAQEKAGSLRSE